MLILDFIENKGQWVSDVRYKVEVPGGAMFLTDKGFVYNYASPEDIGRLHDSHDRQSRRSEEMVRHHAYRVNYINARSGIRYAANDKKPYYHNYILGNDSSMWKGHVRLYASVLQKGVYAGIDVAVYSKTMALKYDFIVAPGANPAQIRLSFEGAQPALTAEGHLKIRTTVNEIIEEAPYAYQEIEGTVVPVACRYRLTDNILSFELPEGYNNTYPLVIDPSVIFATFSGSTGIDKSSYGSTFDASGNMYAASHTLSAGWPVTTGAFQTAYGGLCDVAISKYNPTGTSLIYATYFGGASDDMPYAMVANDREELTVIGHTESNNLPVRSNAFDRTLGGSRDIFVANFSSTGAGLIGATYIGGSGHELHYTNTISSGPSTAYVSPCDVALDENGHIWATGNTQSTNFPVTPGAQQTVYGGGITDAILFRLSPDCTTLEYSSFLGGNGRDVGYSIVINNKKDIIICGGTDSPNFPVSLGALHTGNSGGTDGFVSIVNPVTGLISRSSYLGTSSLDHAFRVQVDATDHVYVVGRTMGNYPISPGVISMSGCDVFVDKLAPDLSASRYSTRLGNMQTMSTPFVPTAFMVDDCGNLYLAGYRWSSGIAGYPLTANAFQSTSGRFWFGVLSPDFANVLFATFYGGSGTTTHLHESIHRFDPKGIIYHSTCATTFPVTPGSYRQSNSTTGIYGATLGQDVVSFKFDLTEFVRADTLQTMTDTVACLGSSVLMEAKNLSGEDYIWNTGSVSGSVRTDTSGIYVVHYRMKSQPCTLFSDSFRVSYSALPELSLKTDSAGCPGENRGQARISVKGASDSLYTYSWHREDDSTMLQTSVTDTGSVIAGLSRGQYRLDVATKSGCDTSLYFTIFGADAPEAAFIVSDSVLCTGETFQFTNKSTGRFDSWIWHFGVDGATSSGFNSRFAYDTAGIYTVSLIVNNTSCADTAIEYVTVKDLSLRLIANVYSIRYGEAVSLQTDASEPYTVYRWIPDPLFPDQHAYSQTVHPDSNSYNVIKVFGRSAYGCLDSAMTVVVVNGVVETEPDVNALVKLPTAFSPNGDGRNDYFRPSVFAGVEMRVMFFEVFDRWGRLVWSEPGVNGLKGWDGTYKGAPAVMGVYFYVIEMEDKWGRRIRYRGDLTLVR